MFFNLIKEINRLGQEIKRLLSNVLIQLRKEIG